MALLSTCAILCLKLRGSGNQYLLSNDAIESAICTRPTAPPETPVKERSPIITAQKHQIIANMILRISCLDPFEGLGLGSGSFSQLCPSSGRILWGSGILSASQQTDAWTERSRFPNSGFPKIRGTFLGVHNKGRGHSILASIVVFPYAGMLSISTG